MKAKERKAFAFARSSMYTCVNLTHGGMFVPRNPLWLRHTNSLRQHWGC